MSIFNSKKTAWEVWEKYVQFYFKVLQQSSKKQYNVTFEDWNLLKDDRFWRREIPNLTFADPTRKYGIIFCPGKSSETLLAYIYENKTFESLESSIINTNEQPGKPSDETILPSNSRCKDTAEWILKVIQSYFLIIQMKKREELFR